VTVALNPANVVRGRKARLVLRARPAIQAMPPQMAGTPVPQATVRRVKRAGVENRVVVIVIAAEGVGADGGARVVVPAIRPATPPVVQPKGEVDPRVQPRVAGRMVVHRAASPDHAGAAGHYRKDG